MLFNFCNFGLIEKVHYLPALPIFLVVLYANLSFVKRKPFDTSSASDRHWEELCQITKIQIGIFVQEFYYILMARPIQMREKLTKSNTMKQQGVGTPACLRGQTSLITLYLTYFDPRGKRPWYYGCWLFKAN